MTTSTDIANLALGLLKQKTIGDIDEDTTLAKDIRRNFAVTRDAILELADWDFARRRASLAASAQTPAFGFKYAYTLPSDLVKLLPVTMDGSVRGRAVPHEKEGTEVLCDLKAPLKIRYIAQVYNYSLWPATAIDLFSTRLAMKMAHWITGKSGYYDIAAKAHKDALDTALLSNAVQGSEPEPEYSEFVDARFVETGYSL